MTYSIRQAAKVIGISRATLRRWLEIDLGYQMPAIDRGSKFLLTDHDIAAIVRKHSPRPAET
jgi:predicted site-specific integrase-resolvase